MIDKNSTVTIDGNQVAATVAHLTNEVIAIYPISHILNSYNFSVSTNTGNKI
ncbi:MAG: hypothetical protein OEZ15_01000 [Gammaproteobacteria bacterium]|nr:hypothetical protein [Gammaproteobacteria bacterium]